METSVLAFVSDNFHTNYQIIRNHFGSPEQIISDCVNEMEAEEMVEFLSFKRRVLKNALVSMLIAFAIWVGYLAVCYENIQNDANGYMIVEVIEVERLEDTEGGQ